MAFRILGEALDPTALLTWSLEIDQAPKHTHPSAGQGDHEMQGVEMRTIMDTGVLLHHPRSSKMLGFHIHSTFPKFFPRVLYIIVVIVPSKATPRIMKPLYCLFFHLSYIRIEGL